MFKSNRMYLRVVSIVSFFFLVLGFVQAQQPERNVVILDARIVSADSLLPVPNAHVISKFNRVGTITNNDGRFRMYVDPHDSLLITSIGFSPKILYITDSIRSLDSVVRITLNKDTIMINEVIIRAFYDYEVFKQLVIEMRPVDLSQFYPNWDGTDLLYRDIKPLTIKGPIQALYDQFNHLARLQRKLIRNREQYNELMRRMGRHSDTIPAMPEHMQASPR